MGFFGTLSRRLHKLNKARFETKGFTGDALQGGLGNAAVNAVFNSALKVATRTATMPYKAARYLYRNRDTPIGRAGRWAAGRTWDFNKGAVSGTAQSLHTTWTGAYHGTKGVGKLLTQRDPNHIFGRSINPIAGDAMIVGGASLGLYQGWRGAKINAEIGDVTTAPIEGAVDQRFNPHLIGNGPISPGIQDRATLTPMSEDDMTNSGGQLALALHNLRRTGYIRG